MNKIKTLGNREISQRLREVENELEDLRDEIRTRAHETLPIERETIDRISIWELLNLLNKIEALE